MKPPSTQIYDKINRIKNQNIQCSEQNPPNKFKSILSPCIKPRTKNNNYYISSSNPTTKRYFASKHEYLQHKMNKLKTINDINGKSCYVDKPLNSKYATNQAVQSSQRISNIKYNTKNSVNCSKSNNKYKCDT